MSEARLKIGLIGLGTMANQLGEAVLQGKDMELYAICTRNPDKLVRYAARWGVERAYTDYRELLADPSVDAVIVATPNYLHAEMTEAALLAGKHVFCEKPPALTAADAKRMMETAQTCGKLLMYGLVFRFSPKHAMIRDLRDQGLFGDFYYGKAGVVRRCGAPGGWFGRRALAGGGPLMDLGPHIIDLAMLVMGNFEPVSVFARTFRAVENMNHVKCYGGYQAAEQNEDGSDVEELASVVINAKNGASLLIETSNVSHIPEDRFYMSMLGTKGGVDIDPELRISTAKNGYLMDMTPVVDCGEFDYHQGILDEIQNFADCVAGKCSCVVPAEAGYRLMRIIEAAYRSAESGQVEFL